MSPSDHARPATARAVVHLVRHGEVANPDHVVYGRLPGFRLSESGRVMAKAAADFLAGRDVTVLRSSPMERALESAEPIAAEFGQPVVVDERLIEAANHFEGLRFAVGNGALREPRYWRYLRNPFRPSWGEAYTEIASRMVSAVRDAAAAASGHEAVCVSHQLPIWVARRSVTGRRLWHDPRRRECALSSVTSLTLAGDQVTEVTYHEPTRDSRPRLAGA